ncbi:hypothetical protein GQ53DRAFT_837684 [Thozetella sp. PMI_491]|nr:hypothetical protein GQ53DRAFT_837684 [Thozetella sp. PMI_491]
MSVNRIGLTQVYCPAGPATVDVYFVHGLFGHPYRTWATAAPTPALDVPAAQKPSRRSIFSRSSLIRTNVTPESSDRLRPGWLSSRSRSSSQHESLASEDSGLSKESSIPSTSSAPNGADDDLDPRDDDSNIHWPRDLLPKLMPSARIFTWGYDVDIAKLFSSTSTASVFQHASTLLSDISDSRIAAEEKMRPIIFVAHSLGGIVVKDALCISNSERTHLNEVGKATAGVCFLGTPHKGSSSASIGKTAFGISRIFLQQPNIGVLRSLEHNSEVLERITRSFSLLLLDSTIKIHSFREELPYHGVMIVEPESSFIGDGLETTGTIHAHHRNITKFSTITDPGFRRVASVLKRWEKECHVSGEEPDHNKEEHIFQALLQSLNMVQSRQRLEDVQDPFKDTYSWVFKSDIGFTNWLRQAHGRFFWIQGKPGSGKSTMMKYILNQDETTRLLPPLSQGRWVVKGFFFHDRGAESQKSIEGLLRELLYQTLRSNSNLLRVIARIYIQKLIPRPLETISEHGWSARDIAEAYAFLGKKEVVWEAKDVLSAFWLINTARIPPVHLCFFVDALDEHSGNHRELLNVLNSLAEPKTRGALFVKMCVASRPENIFQDAFSKCPGFKIHEHTRDDITKYAITRLREESYLVDGYLDHSFLDVLIPEILEKAEGVFIWVRLVVEELLEGLCDGDTISELRDLLSALPTELGDLYHRALLRYRVRRRTRVITPGPRHELEAHIMLQIAACAVEPFQLHELISAALYLAGISSSSAMTEDEMKRRLRAKTGGLLEVSVTSESKVVQFIHQTAKEFVLQDPRSACLAQARGLEDMENGHVLLQRYLIHHFSNGSFVRVKEFATYAAKADLLTGMAYTEDLLKLCENDSNFKILLSNLDLGPSFWALLDRTGEPEFWLLILAVAFSLHNFLISQIEGHSLGAELYPQRLATAIAWASYCRWPRWSLAGKTGVADVLDALFRRHWPDMRYRGNLPLQSVFSKYQLPYHDTSTTNRSVFDNFDSKDYDLKLIQTLLKLGSDPNTSVTWEENTSPPLHLAINNAIMKVWSNFPAYTMAEVLLRAGSDPSGLDSFGNTALYYAIDNNDTRIIHLLVTYGADLCRLNATGLNFWHPTEAAFAKSGRNCMAFLQKCSSLRPRLINMYGYEEKADGPMASDSSHPGSNRNSSGRSSRQSLLSVLSLSHRRSGSQASIPESPIDGARKS